MSNLFDKNMLEVCESYIGYGRDDLDKMSESELNNELKRTEREMEEIEEEIDEADGFPSYAMKERLENMVWYRNRIKDAIANLKNKVSVKESCDDGKYHFKTFKKSLKDYKK